MNRKTRSRRGGCRGVFLRDFTRYSRRRCRWNPEGGGCSHRSFFPEPIVKASAEFVCGARLETDGKKGQRKREKHRSEDRPPQRKKQRQDRRQETTARVTDKNEQRQSKRKTAARTPTARASLWQVGGGGGSSEVEADYGGGGQSVRGRWRGELPLAGGF